MKTDPGDRRPVRTAPTVFVHVTKLCNVNCPRCYLTQESRQSRQHLAPSLLLELLAHPFFSDAGDMVSRHTSSGRHDSTNVIWQGGEPTLIGERAMSALVEAVQAAHPGIWHSMVTNLFRSPPWLVDFAKAHFDARLDTTFALGGRLTLDGNRDRYLAEFARCLTWFWREGVEVSVNVELNRETIEAGVDVFADFMIRTEARSWHFDFSIDFARFHAQPQYGRGHYPLLPMSTTLDEFYSFIERLMDAHGARLEAAGIAIGNIHETVALADNRGFNVAQEDTFITVNPDGTVTTNPLFADLTPTFLGNLAHDSVEAILAHPNRQRRIAHERRRPAACGTCRHLPACRGGPSHVPVWDGSGNCAGGVTLWDRLASAPVPHAAQILGHADGAMAYDTLTPSTL